jgi:hypothetical protein
LSLSDEKVAKQCMDHFDPEEFGLRQVTLIGILIVFDLIYHSKSTVKRKRKLLGLLGTRQRGATWQDIEPLYIKIRAKFPNMGARGMVSLLRQEYGMKVPEYIVLCF